MTFRRLSPQEREDLANVAAGLFALLFGSFLLFCACLCP